MHGTREQLDRYARRDLDPPTLAALDAHVASCLPCSMMLAEAGSSAARWERRGLLGRLVRVDERVEERTIVAPFPSRQPVLQEQAA
ncbi:MAG TPA: zf-HC2 domain-containing protein [Gaiellaceae bacterium]